MRITSLKSYISLLILIGASGISGCDPSTIVTTNVTSPFNPTPVVTSTTPTQTCSTGTCVSTCPTGTCNGGITTGNPSSRSPEIGLFTADSPRLGGWNNNGTFIRWDVSDFNAIIRIDPYPGNVPSVGSAFILPQVTTTYTLTARNNFGTAQRQLTVIVTSD